MISLIFKFINFGIVVGLILYGFKRYGLPLILHQLEADKKYKDSLDKERIELDTAQLVLDRETDDQEQRCVILSEKIDEWNKIILSNFRQKEIQAQDALEVTQKRRQRQSIEYGIQKAHAIVSTCVEKRLQEELIVYFADEKVAQKYIQHILSSIEKK